MKVRAVDFVVYTVPDMTKAKEFYGQTLGLSHGSEFTEFWAEFATEPTTLCLCDPYPDPDEEQQWPGWRSWVGGPAIALAVDDVAAAVEELRAKGVPILKEPQETGVCYLAFVADPFGNRVCLHQRKDGTAG